MKAIVEALLKAQSEMSNPKKGSNNPYFKSKYADLNAVREAVIPILNNHGIIVLQPTVNVDGKNYIKTVLYHESGESIEGLTEIIYSKANDAQAQGSGITYARRYGLQSLVCIGADDDDGNGASSPKGKTQTKPQSDNADLALALQEIKEAKTITGLTSIFNNWGCFQSNSLFVSALTIRKNELKQTA